MKKILNCIYVILIFSFTAQSQDYSQWIKKRESLKQDPSVARYYTFENVKESKNIVYDLSKNQKNLTYVPYTDPTTKEVFDDLQVIEGRWQEKNAVRLDRGFYRGEPFNIQNNQFTAEVWFRRQGPGSILPASKRKNGTILSVSGFSKGWRILTSYEQSMTLSFEVGQPLGATIISTSLSFSDNIWQHLVVTFDGSEMNIYLNGKLAKSNIVMRDEKRAHIKTERFKGEYVPTNTPFVIGYSGHGVGSTKLDIDEVVIYNRVLKPEEIIVSREEMFLKADSLLKKGDFNKAREEYKKIKGFLGDGVEMALLNIAESYRLEKDYQNTHKTYKEFFEIQQLNPFYKIYGLFQEAEVYLSQKNYKKARELLEQVKNTEGALKHHIFTAYLKIGDTYREEKKYSQARQVYINRLIAEEASSFPNDGYRLDLRDRLEEIEGLKDGTEEKSRQDEYIERINKSTLNFYISPSGKDSNRGTKNSPFRTISRAQEEVRATKKKGTHKGGISIFFREGTYFLQEPIVFSQEDSGTEDSPIVYRSYPNENVKIVGGIKITNFMPLKQPEILKRLPEEARKEVWVADLKSQGIDDYGTLLNRGFGPTNLSAMELIYNGEIMHLARWPNDSWLRVAALVDPKGDYEFRKVPYQKGKFIYSEDRPARWKEEDEIWLKGYMGVQTPYAIKHLKVSSIDTEKKIMYVEEDPRFNRPDPGHRGARIAAKHPYFAYNLLSEIDTPGEWYLDRKQGKLYFYPPKKLKRTDEVVGTTFETPLIQLKNASYISFFGLTIEGGRSHGFEISGGKNNLIASSTIRNTGQWAVRIAGGWNHAVIGCDIYDTGEGGISLNGGDRIKLIPSNHLVENNHIYRFNRFDGGYCQGVSIDGIGQRISRNLIYDAPHQLIYFNANDHIIEFNELHDGPHEGREIGAMYIYGEPWYFMSRGIIIRNNYFHHISTHSSPNLSHGLNSIHLDAINAGIVIDKNIYYRFPNGISSTQPGNYLTNNYFIDGSGRSISQGDRSSILCKDGDIEKGPNVRMVGQLALRLKSVNYKQPPWNYRYPPLVGMIEKEPSVWGEIQGSIIERNVNTGGRFIAISRGVQATTYFKNNWDGINPLFINREEADFRLRTGASVIGYTGCEPLTMDTIGVYKSPLRATWPIDRKKSDIGKYYKIDNTSGASSSQRINPPSTYNISLRKTPIVIDGKLDNKE
ncbi:right-handed parallel beta-helix repeat-containing protein [bacterium]|nr:right-handed parallel beta-helix repeat-containing protein [bacterium]